MRFTRAIAGTFAFATCASATSLGTLRPHSPVLARQVIERLVASIDANDLERLAKEGVPWPFIYTNELGFVNYDKRVEFLKFMNKPEGKEDEKPIKITRARIIANDKIRPIYLVELERTVWRLKDYETNDMLLDEEIDRPHYQRETSYWLVGFVSDRVQSLRQVDEFYWPERGV